MRQDVLLDYLTYGDLYPSGTADTHFAGVSQVLPGHHARFDLASWQFAQTPYFCFFEPPADAGDTDDPDLLVRLLKDSVRKRLVSDRPVGLLLSGGIDSSLILSTLVSLGLQDQCHIFMGDTGRSEDYAYAKRCVEQLGVKAETVVLDYDHNTFERFLQIIRHQEKPVSLNGSSMGMPQMYEVIAAHGVPVVLDGTGGDELFGGYWQRQFPYAVRDAVKAGEWGWLREQLQCKAGENEVKRHLLNALLPAAAVEQSRTLKRKARAWANPYLKAGARAVFATAPTDPLSRQSMHFTEALCTDLAPGGRLGEWLWHNDRNSMMSSVEGRSPLLDYRLNRFAYTPYQRKFLACWNKHELRSAFDALTPLPTQWRQQKQGFRWDGRHFLHNNQGRILELMRENRSLADLVDVPRLVATVSRQPRLLKSSFCKQVLAVSAVDLAFD
jgi:asparagine synthase (glutamine-hydrolysing)